LQNWSLVDAANIRWTMPNTSGVRDHNFGPIEAAISETARGLAFLADDARRMRQSDTWTMLAMIGRLERRCQELAVRLGDLDRRDPVFADLVLEPSSEPAAEIIGRKVVSLLADHSDVPAVIAGDRISLLPTGQVTTRR
jgi:hypothetical protein